MTDTKPGSRAERDITFNLLKNLTLREIRSEYKRTALGRVWSLINPLAQIAVYSVVFGLILQVSVAPGPSAYKKKGQRGTNVTVRFFFCILRCIATCH